LKLTSSLDKWVNNSNTREIIMAINEVFMYLNIIHS
jgi:hypothetical protein